MKRWEAGEQILVEEVWNGKLWSVRPVLVVDARADLLVFWSPKGSVRKVPTVPGFAATGKDASRAPHVLPRL